MSMKTMARSQSKPLHTGNKKKLSEFNKIIFLTDFGLEDPYVGVCKCVINKIAPRAQVLDLTHGISPQNLYQAQIFLESSMDYLPTRSIILAVVDPGVGTRRAQLLIESKEYFLIGPDNGIFTSVLNRLSSFKAYEIKWELFSQFLQQFGLPAKLSSTFHARDVFSPAAALIAIGISPAEFSKPIQNIKRLEIPEPEIYGKRVKGEILFFDHFGNAITNISELLLEKCVKRGLKSLEVSVESRDQSRIPFVKLYSSVKQGQPLSLIGSFGLLEIAVNQGSAKDQLRLQEGQRIELIF